MTDMPIPDGSESIEQLDVTKRFGPPIDQYLVDIGALEAAVPQGTVGPFSDFVDQVLRKTTDRVGSLEWLLAGVEPADGGVEPPTERQLPRFNLTEFPTIPLYQEPKVLIPIRPDDTTTTTTSPLPRLIPIDELRKELPHSVLELLTELREELQEHKFSPLEEKPDLLTRFGFQRPTPVDDPAQHDAPIDPFPEADLPKETEELLDSTVLNHRFVPPTDEEFARRTYRLALEFLRDIGPNMFNNQLYIKGTPKVPLNPSIFVEEYYLNPKLPEPKEYIENNPKPKGEVW